MSPAALKSALREKLGDIEPTQNSKVTPLWARSLSQVQVEALTIETDPGITVPVYVLKPAESSRSPMPVEVAVAQAGRSQFLAQRSNEILALLRRQVAVCLPDVRDTGEPAAKPSRGPEAMDLAATEFMLGQTSTRRTFHSGGILSRKRMLSISNLIKRNARVRSRRAASGRAPKGPLGSMAGVYEDHVDAIAARGGLTSFLSVLEDRFCHVPEDVVVPGILQTADVPDIIEAQSMRPVLLERFVGGRNRPARPAVNGAPGLTIREATSDGELAQWLVTHSGY